MEIEDHTGLGLAWLKRCGKSTREWPHRRVTEYLAVHRAWWAPFDPSQIYQDWKHLPANAASLAALHDGQPRYTFHVLPDGRIQQAWPLWAKTNHAYLKNRVALGTCVMWSSHHYEVPQVMQTSLEWLLLHLQGLYTHARIERHDQIPDAINRTKYPDKQCPGKGLELETMARDIETILYAAPELYTPELCRERLVAAGAVM